MHRDSLTSAGTGFYRSRSRFRLTSAKGSGGWELSAVNHLPTEGTYRLINTEGSKTFWKIVAECVRFGLQLRDRLGAETMADDISRILHVGIRVMKRLR